MIAVNKQVTTVVCVDDHHVVREGIKSWLQSHSDIELVGEGGAGQDVLELLAKHKPNILLLDLNMPQRPDKTGQFHAMPTLAQVHQEYPDTRTIILSQQYAPVLIDGAVKRGVMGYLLKSDDLSFNLPSAIRTVSQGGVYFSETISQQLFSPSHPLQNVTLSQRQIEILSRIAMYPNDSYIQHAQELQISENTLKNHLYKTFKALGVSNITAALITSMRLGIIHRV